MGNAIKFTDNGNGTITDNATGLMWTKTSMPGGTWYDAINTCENLTLAGYTDWRLPNIKELESIVDYSQSNNVPGQATIDNTKFVCERGLYWSSTTYTAVSRGDSAYVVDFSVGYVPASQTLKSLPCYVRPCRSQGSE